MIRTLAKPRVLTHPPANTSYLGGSAAKASSTNSSATSEPEKSRNGKSDKPVRSDKPEQELPAKQKTMAEKDEELRLKMQGIAGDGGESGIEYEDGKPVAMKRSVKSNMFRLI